MKWIRYLFFRRQAGFDAVAGVDLVGEAVESRLGSRPEFDPAKNAKHRRLTERLQVDPREEDAREDLVLCDDELSRHPAASSLVFLLAFLFVIETLGCVQLMARQGWGSPERVVFGFALAAALFLLVRMAAGAATSGKVDLAGRKRRSAGSILILIVAGIVFVALSTLRLTDGAVERGWAASWATSVVLIVFTLGPAVAAERVLTRLEPVTPLLRKRRALRARILFYTLSRRLAQRHYDRVSAARDRWEAESKRLRTEYRLIQKRARMTRHRDEARGQEDD